MIKDDKLFDSWNQSVVATAYMHHTQKVLDENYKPKSAAERDLFDEMQFLCSWSYRRNKNLRRVDLW
jgi:hypothetical protein